MDGLFPAMEGAASRHHDTAPAPFRTTTGVELARHLPVARVHVLGVLPHLDRVFEYAIPQEFDDLTPGQRVRVRFSGKVSEAFVRERVHTPDTTKPLAPISDVIAPESVVSSSMFALCDDIAARYAGSVSDVLRLAVPPRSAGAEKQVRAQLNALASPASDAEPESSRESHDVDPGAQASERPSSYARKFAGLAAFLTHVRTRTGAVPRAHLVLDPVDSWIDLVVEALAYLEGDEGAIIMASDQRDADRASRAIEAAGYEPALLSSSAGPHKRYAHFLRVNAGLSRIVVGTRSAIFAPVSNVRLIIMFDPDDDLFEEIRAPYPHARSIALSRSFIESVPVLFLCPSPSATLTALEGSRALVRLTPRPEPHALTHPRIELMDSYLREREGGSGHSRLPSHAFHRIREGLRTGPVLVSVPRTGYAVSLSCGFCGTRAVCLTCHASLTMPHRASDVLICAVCARSHAQYSCPTCGKSELRARTLGSARTAEDLMRAFPTAVVHTSGGPGGVVADAAVHTGHIVVSTPGAEPLPSGGYASAVIVDADLTLSRAVYDADTEAVRRFSHVIAATRTFSEGGEVLILGTATHRALRSLVMVRSWAFISSVVHERSELQLPPSAKVAEVQASPQALRHYLSHLELPDSAQLFGPVAMEGLDEDVSRLVVRAPAEQGSSMIGALRAALLVHTAKKLPGSIRIHVDPPHVF